jgi:uncharacterized membrane protein YgdD (TMEM256/DUF423 family)
MTVLDQINAAPTGSPTGHAAVPTGLARAIPGRGWIAYAAISGAVSVIVGAFAAHGLDPVAEAREIGWLHTGSQYQSLHALAMLAVLALATAGYFGGRMAKMAQWFFLVGNILFPIALYGLAFHLPLWLGAVAPLGGSAYILGWISLAAAAFARPKGAT